LSQLYSNNSRLFPAIDFNGVVDTELSVIFARVKKPKDTHKDSHNLGKTVLVDLIDFLLLKDLSSVPNHFLAKHRILFADWIFYLELRNTKGQYITVRRSVKEPTKIAFKMHPKRLPVGAPAGVPNVSWDHIDVALDRAVQLLDGHLGLTAIKPFAYRSGVGYFLRTQGDYRDLFQLAKTSEAPDKDWKPYLAKLFGIDPDLVMRKYKLDEEVAELKKRADEIQQSVPSIRTRNLNELRMDVSSRRELLSETEGRIDRFKFAQEELRISKAVAGELEAEDVDLNQQIANLDYDIAQMRSSVQRTVMFDLARIKKIFDETQTFFSPQLIKQYDELVDFNKTITAERSKFLKKQIADLEKERSTLAGRKAEVDDRRAQYYEILQEHDTFRKFKSLQKEQAVQRAEVEQKLLQIRKLEELLQAERLHKAKQLERSKLIEEIDTEVAQGTAIQARINNEFARMVNKVLSLNGSVYLKMNQNGNIDPQHTADPSNVDAGQSSQSEGNTYKRLLCILFDFAVLKAYAKSEFFRFVYHDGLLETMDDRKKVELLQLLKEFADETGVQCIFSVIESEMPLNPDGHRRQFSTEQIIRELSDDGSRGRLFKMPSF
jgi:uncharacterized protein YydD (DUF2326 family)